MSSVDERAAALAPTAPRPLPLAGVTVLDLTHIYNGPYATFLMAMAGADVVKVEPPGGEHLRHRAELGGAAVPFAMLNANKRAITLDFKSERGHELLLDLAARADVVVENFAPGVLDRNGLGYEALSERNPQLVYASASGYGLSGPNRDFPAMDLTVQAMSGVLATTGLADSPPLKAGPALADFFGGVHLYGGIVTALFERERTGRGRLVEISMQEATYASLSSSIGMYFADPSEPPRRTGNRHSGLAESPYNVYPTRDGFIAIVGNHDRHFLALLKLMEREDLAEDPRFIGLKARAAHMDEVDALVTEWTSRFDKEPLARRLLDARVPCAPVREIPDVVRDEHMHARGALAWQDHPSFGRIVVQRSPMRYRGSELIELQPSAELGEHNAAVLRDWLGLDEQELAELVRERIV
jgi:crotonobetainyl-CoA:carnitine CoA-transferase CaiB-like acyl-CoA transferase